MITTVLFDLDGTLYDRDTLVRSLAAEQFNAFRAELEHIGRQAFVERLIELDEHGHGSKEALYRRMGEEWSLAPRLQALLLEHFWSSYDGHCTPHSDTLQTLRALKSDGKRLGIITNGGTARQNRKIDALGVRRFLDVILISEAEGLRKPDPAIFARALERCSAAPHEALYVGDHPRDDVEGARSAGLLAVWKAVPYWQLRTRGVRQIRRLGEILPLCGASGPERYVI